MVVTGVGLVTPLGVGVGEVWPALLAGRSALTAVTSSNFPSIAALELPSRVVAPLPPSCVEPFIPPTLRSSTSPFIHYALAAASLALTDSAYRPSTPRALDRSGVCIGSGIGSVEETATQSRLLHERGRRGVSPYGIPRLLANLAAGHVSIQHRFRGPNHTTSTACTTGAHSIGDAARFILHGDADVMLAGGTEQGITPLSMALFSRCRALSTRYNDTPLLASQPFSRGRDGFVMGDGAAVLVLEELEHAKARGARIYAEVRGYGCSADAHHITAPPADGHGARLCMQRALDSAGLLPSHIDYINAHATSTPLGDAVENRAIHAVFGAHAQSLSVSSTKGAVGHLLGAAGAVEAAFTALAIHHQQVPPTLNLDVKGERGGAVGGDAGEEREEEGAGAASEFEFDLDYVPHAKQRRVRAAMTNSFGFGGTNASLVFAEVGDG